MNKIASVTVSVMALTLLAGCSNNSNNQNKSTHSPSQKGATAFTVKKGNYKVGTDIKAGTYIITPKGSDEGYITSSSTGDGLDLSIDLGEPSEDYSTTSQFRAILKKGTNLDLTEIKKAHFKPAPAMNEVSSGKLKAGEYKIGQDIKPGRYTISLVKGSGDLETDDLDTDFTLGTDKDYDEVKSVVVQLKKGQILWDYAETVTLTSTHATVTSSSEDDDSDTSSSESSSSASSSSSSSSNDETTDEKAWLSDYKAFADQYSAFVEKYKGNESDADLISQLSDLESQEVQMASDAENYKGDFTGADLDEYTQATDEIAQAAASLAQ